MPANVYLLVISILISTAACTRAPDWYGPDGIGRTRIVSLCEHSKMSAMISRGRIKSAAYPSRVIEIDIPGTTENKFEVTDLVLEVDENIVGETPKQAIIGNKVSNKGDGWFGKLWLDGDRDAVSLLFLLEVAGHPPSLVAAIHQHDDGSFRFPTISQSGERDAQGNYWEIVAAGDAETTILDYRNSGAPCASE